jgi:hypothetical protein
METNEKYFILERRGRFYVFCKLMWRSYFLGKARPKKILMYKDDETPAVFDSLEEAREWVRIYQQPDIIHLI